MTKKEKKQMEKQAEALKKARGKTTKVVKKKLDSNFNDLSNSVDVINEEIIIDFSTFRNNLNKTLLLTHRVSTKAVIDVVDEMYEVREKVKYFKDIEDKRLNDFNAKKAAEKVQKIDEVTKNKINKIISERQASGTNAKQIAKEVRENVKEMTKSRTLTIARTETAKASGYSMHELAKETLVNTKVWMHAGGGATDRKSHLDMNGEERKIDEAFSNGLMYAHDPDAEAGDVINCYCVTTYKFKV